MRKLTERRIVVATHNAGKVAEINNLIAPFGFSAQSAAELGLLVPEETGTTFEENARIKAVTAALETNMPALADDSGLCVDALAEGPGIYSADWAEKQDGSGRDFSMAMQKVENALQANGATSPDKRGAKFVAVLCMAWPDGHAEFFRGEVGGQIVWPPRGDAGFGYDPIFQPEDHSRTFGEMSAEEKHSWNASRPGDALSHRARAFTKFAAECLADHE